MLSKADGPFGEGSTEFEEVFLNLTPMIDVLTCLVFFLLLSFGAVVLALVEASVPVLADAPSPSTASQGVVTMGLTINDKALVLSASNDSMSEAELNKLKRTFPKKGAAYDFKGLADYLYQIKKRFRESKTIIITPEPDIDYEVIVAAMDASRERRIVFSRREVRMPLFPEAVISSLVK